jgi:hypothetical protein
MVLLEGCGPSVEETAEPRIELEFEARLGSLDGALSLSDIRAMALTQGRGDTAVILRTQLPFALVLASSGDSLGVMGHAGAEPGECPGAGRGATSTSRLLTLRIIR